MRLQASMVEQGAVVSSLFRICDRLLPACRTATLIALIALGSSARGGGITTIEDHYFGATLFIVETGNKVWPPVPVASLDDYLAVYGAASASATDYGRLAAEQFFANGGKSLFVIDPGGVEIADFQAALNASDGLNVDLVAMPGAACCDTFALEHAAIMNQLIAHVDDSPNRFGLIDAPKDSSAAELIDYRSSLSSVHAGLYAPWLNVVDETATGDVSVIPSSAAVAGVISRIDREQGIYAAPAGTDAIIVQPPLIALERDLSADSDTLNPQGINTLREFGSPPDVYIWGARTMTDSNTPTKYVAISRFLRHLEYSMTRSLAWLNDEQPGDVYAGIVETLIEDYLYNYWTEGALLGTTVEEAYFVSCMNEPPDLTCIVGVAVQTAAEFELIPLAIAYRDGIFQSRFQ